MRSQFGFALAVALISSFAAPPARAQQAEIEFGNSLVCDTQKQVERFVALFDGNVEKAVRAVNSEVKDPTACAVIAVAFVRGAAIATTRTSSGAYRIMPILVLGVIAEGGIRDAVPTLFYSMVKIAELDA